MAHQVWDKIMRLLVHANPHAFIDLIFPGAQFLRLHPTRLIDTQLEVDAAIEVTIHGQRLILHIEFQTYNDYTMPKRLARYYLLLWWQNELKLPIRSYVIYLLRDGKVALAPLFVKAPGEEPGQCDEMMRFQYGCIEINKVDPSRLIQKGHSALLPLLPLTQKGATRAMVELMFDALAGKEQQSFAFCGFLLAGLAFQQYTRDKSNLQWLERRYDSMRDNDPFYESSIYQWLVAPVREQAQKQAQEARELAQKQAQEAQEQARKQAQEAQEQARKQAQEAQEQAQKQAQQAQEQAQKLQKQTLTTLRLAALNVLRIRFPLLVPLAETQLTSIHNIDLLQRHLLQISAAENTEQAILALTESCNNQDN